MRLRSALRDARAVVLDLDEHVLLVAAHVHDHLAARRRELDRVVDEVGQQLTQTVLVTHDHGRPHPARRPCAELTLWRSA